MPITLTGEVERITYESEATGFRVLKIGSLEGPAEKRGSVTVVGTLPPVGSGTPPVDWRIATPRLGVYGRSTFPRTVRGHA